MAKSLEDFTVMLTSIDVIATTSPLNPPPPAMEIELDDAESDESTIIMVHEDNVALIVAGVVAIPPYPPATASSLVELLDDNEAALNQNVLF